MAMGGDGLDWGERAEPDLPLRPGENPYPHWAQRMAAADADPGVVVRTDAPGGAPRPGAPFDGRRLRLPLGEDEIAAAPVVVRLGGRAGSPERDAARRALAARVDRGTLRMDAHERALLAERSEPGNRPPDGLVPFARIPTALLEDEVYCHYLPGGEAEGDASDPDHDVVEQGIRMALPREPSDPWSVPDPEPPCEACCEGDPPVVGVIDDGIAFLNARFRRPGARATRFDAVWLQAFRAAGGARGATLAGTILQAPAIDAWLARGDALDEAAVYRRLGRALHQAEAHRALERGFSHGTHVADLAAGADPDGGDEARGWPLLGVQLPPEAVDDTAGRYLEPLMIGAVRWILWRARRLGRGPVVITVSMGSLAGPKDGSRAIEWVVAHELALFEARTGRLARVNWSFGNARLGRQVARFEEGQAPVPLDWRLQPDDRAASFLEIRPEGGQVDELTLELTMPDGRRARLPAPDPRRPTSVVLDGRLAFRLYRAPVPRRGRGDWSSRPETPCLVLAAAPTLAPAGPHAPRAPAGAYRVAVRWSGAPGALRLEVQRGDTAVGHRAAGRQSTLDHPCAHSWERETAAYTDPTRSAITRAGTHTANAAPRDERVWATGAARPGRTADAPRPARYAAAGTVQRPHSWPPVAGPTLSALADRGAALRGLVAAGTLSGSARISGGSSAAAPVASRAIALTLAGRRAPGGPLADEVADVVARHGAPADPGREGLPTRDADHLEPADPPEPGDAARLGAGTVTRHAGRGSR